jgi:hypothetical protein
MELIKGISPTKKIEYIHFIEYKNEKYRREEYISQYAFCWENSPDKLEDLHTIKWFFYDDENEEIIEYFNLSHGWSKNGIMDKKNKMPTLEKEFKKIIGKNLLTLKDLKNDRI